MKETTLLKIALACSLIGLFVLYFISIKVDVKDYMPKLNENIGDNVRLEGTVAKITDAGDVVFVEVSYQNSVTVVMFTDENSLKLSSGDNIEVIGEVQEYKGKNEIIADKIRVIR